MLLIDRLQKRWLTRALRLHNGNRSHASEYLGISLRTVRNWIRRYKIDIPPDGIPSGWQYRKIGDGDAEKMNAMRANGVTVTAIADHFGVSRSCVYYHSKYKKLR